MRIHVRLAIVTVGILIAGMTPAQAIHWYRGTSGNCTPNDGALGDAPEPNGATVRLLHNAYETAPTDTSVTGFRNDPPTTTIQAGQSITWTWNSSHCHSVTFDAQLDSGFYYPTAPPESPQVAPGAFNYPVLDESPTLSWTHTFASAGTYAYSCVHHASIGMTGTVVVV